MSAVKNAVRTALFVQCPVCLGDGTVACNQVFEQIVVTRRTCSACAGTGQRSAYDQIVALEARARAQFARAAS